MRVVNNQKAMAKNYIRSDLKSNHTNLLHEDRDLQDTIAILCNLVGGSNIGADQKMIGCCQRARDTLSKAVRELHTAANLLEQLDTTEETGNNEFY